VFGGIEAEVVTEEDNYDLRTEIEMHYMHSVFMSREGIPFIIII